MSRHRIEGSRLYLRDVESSDVTDAYVRWMNDPEVTRFLESRFKEHTRESLLRFVNGLEEDSSNVLLAIVLREGDRHIGNIKLGPIDWKHKRGEIGLLIGERDTWGHGYASEAIDLVSRLAFEQLDLYKVYAGCYSNNTGSLKAFLNAGFEREGVRPRHFLSDDRWVDHVLLGRFRVVSEA